MMVPLTQHGTEFAGVVIGVLVAQHPASAITSQYDGGSSFAASPAAGPRGVNDGRKESVFPWISPGGNTCHQQLARPATLFGVIGWV